MHAVGNNTALAKLTDKQLSDWGPSAEEGFGSYPAGFQPVAVVGASSLNPIAYSDGFTGTPYILAKAKDLVVVPRAGAASPPPPMGATPLACAKPCATVLILGSALNTASPINEKIRAELLGFGTKVATDAEWAAMSTADFASYLAIVIPDASDKTASVLGAAAANKAVWGPAVSGNAIVMGANPVANGGASLITAGIAFATDVNGTGLYVCLSDFYTSGEERPVDLLSYFGTFTAGPPGGAGNNAHLGEHCWAVALLAAFVGTTCCI